MTERTVIVHGHDRAYTLAGSGPALLLLHGIGSERQTWAPVLPLLAEHFTVIAPDLLGHGASAKPRADYSLGGYANGMRDLLGLLEIETVTVVGHSFGGGVAMQFAYQFPERTERLVLVATGGLGPEVSILLRVLTLPTAPAVLTLSHFTLIRPLLRTLAAATAAVAPAPIAADLAEALTVYTGLRSPAARAAFLRVLHHVMDWRGQLVTMRDRSYLTAGMPTLIVWGERDSVVPASHAVWASREMPHSRLVLMPDVGHFPHRERPEAFSRSVVEFVADTAPSTWDAGQWRSLLHSRTISPIHSPRPTRPATPVQPSA
jgi:pimeloyl-ACP methyl ester carboxylesterase